MNGTEVQKTKQIQRQFIERKIELTRLHLNEAKFVIGKDDVDYAIFLVEQAKTDILVVADELRAFKEMM